jgi:hypothetical protein
MLTIQQRIEDYHYAYGSWLDKYQAPHPYSIHNYFDKKTLDLFDRAFVCGQERPTAKEWQEHLWYLLHNMRQCKQNPDHIYFTSKGCGLCAAEEKLAHQLTKIKQESTEPQKVRGLELSALSSEEVAKQKAEQALENQKLKVWTAVFFVFYFLFLGGFYYLLQPVEKAITSQGIGLQTLAILFLTYFIHLGLTKLSSLIPALKNRGIFNMLLIYAIFCLVIIFISLNHIPFSLFALTE